MFHRLIQACLTVAPTCEQLGPGTRQRFISFFSVSKWLVGAACVICWWMSAKDSALIVAPEFMVEVYLDLPSLAAAQQADEGARKHSELRGDPHFVFQPHFIF